MSNDALRKLAGDSVIYGLSSVVPRLLNYFLVSLHTRVFGRVGYGEITELYAYVAILLVVLTFGLETGYFRYASLGDDQGRKRTYASVFWFLGGTSVSFFLHCFFNSLNISQALGYEGRESFIVILAGIISLDAWSAIIFDKLRLAGRAVAFSGVKILSVLINIAGNLIFLLLFPKYGLYDKDFGVGYVLLSNLLGSASAFVIALVLTGGLPGRGRLRVLGEVFVFSFPLLLGGLGGVTNEFVDRFMIKWLTPAVDAMVEVGIYGANVKIAVLMVLCVQMFKFAAEPFFFKEAGKRSDPRVYATVTKWFTYFTLVMLVGILFALPVVQYFVGEEFRVGLGVVPVMLVANVLYGLYFNVSFWYKIQNKTWYAVAFVLLGALVTVSANLALTPRMSYYGAAWARVACYAVMVYVCVAVGRRYFRVPYEWGRMGLVALASLLVGAVGMVLPIENVLALLTIRFALGMLLVAAILKVEKISLLKLLNRWNVK